MFDDEIEALARTVLEAARKRGATLATVESCTGGLVGGALTAIAGSSDVVDGGWITYSNAAKARLGVPAALIDAHGAVSAPVAVAMAEAGRAAVGRAAVVAVAITGVAGPGGGSAEKPVGLVQFALTPLAGPTIQREHRFGNLGRDGVRRASVKAALALFVEAL